MKCIIKMTLKLIDYDYEVNPVWLYCELALFWVKTGEINAILSKCLCLLVLNNIALCEAYSYPDHIPANVYLVTIELNNICYKVTMFTLSDVDASPESFLIGWSCEFLLSFLLLSRLFSFWFDSSIKFIIITLRWYVCLGVKYLTNNWL